MDKVTQKFTEQEIKADKELRGMAGAIVTRVTCKAGNHYIEIRADVNGDTILFQPRDVGYVLPSAVRDKIQGRAHETALSALGYATRVLERYDSFIKDLADDSSL